MLKQSFIIIIILFMTTCKKSINNPQIYTYPDYSENFPILTGEYLDQTPPGMIPELFAPGIVSTERYEHSYPTFSPDGKELFWCSQFKELPGILKILYMKIEEGQWTPPEFAFFTGEYTDANPYFSHDGNKFFFKSRRPITENGSESENIWVITKTVDGWSEPELFGYPFQQPYPFNGGLSWQHSMTEDGTIYFTVETPNDHNIYRTKFEDGRYTNPEKLSDKINTEYNDWEPLIAPDESYLIFGSPNRPDGYGNDDLYISFRKPDDTWTEAENMGKTINTTGDETFSGISPDGQYFFFTRADNILWNGDVYWVDAKIIEDLKPEELK